LEKKKNSFPLVIAQKSEGEKAAPYNRIKCKEGIVKEGEETLPWKRASELKKRGVTT